MFAITLQFSLLSFTGLMQITLFFALIPARILFQKVLRVQKLTSYFKESKFFRRSVFIFVSTFIIRGLLLILHSIWAVVLFIKLKNGEVEVDDLIFGYESNDVTVFLEDLVDFSTVALCFFFFILL